MQKNIQKGTKGITLIALVITIIVLLILAGVTIASLTGTDSAPVKANEAKQKNDIGAAKDEVYLYASNAQTEAYERVYVEGKKFNVDEYATAGEASTEVSKFVKDKIKTEYASDKDKKVGLASIVASTDGGTITISTTDFEETGTIGATGGTLTWSGVTTNNGITQSTGTKILVGDTEIDLNTLDASTVGQYYGTTVANLNGVDYGLFYVDYAGTYSGGEAGTIYLRAKTSVGSTALNSPSLSSDALNIMKQLNPQWNSARGTATSLTSAEQGAQHLCNPAVSKWSAAKTAAETEFGASNVNYVIGAPSVELYLASYNAKYSSGYSADFRAAGANYTYPGYLYSNNGGSSYAQSYSNAIPSNNSGGGMYLNTSTSEWLASPLSATYDYYVCSVYANGNLDYSAWSIGLGVAPLVSLKSGVDLTQD